MMAIEIKRRKPLTEALHLYHADGKLAETIEVMQDPARLAPKVNQGINEIIRAEKALAKAEQGTIEQKGEAIDLIGEASIGLIKIIFGDEQTAKILAFYEGNWAEMVEDLIPVLQSDIVPAIQKAAKERKDRIAKTYTPRPAKWQR